MVPHLDGTVHNDHYSVSYPVPAVGKAEYDERARTPQISRPTHELNELSIEPGAGSVSCKKYNFESRRRR
ncbi:hypothetical protein J6590_063538 [Homalodisca vitripennis]|nr:hypothetical protein J6590_063538 [Homalodisca vitripennis]